MGREGVGGLRVWRGREFIVDEFTRLKETGAILSSHERMGLRGIPGTGSLKGAKGHRENKTGKRSASRKREIQVS